MARSRWTLSRLVFLLVASSRHIGTAFAPAVSRGPGPTTHRGHLLHAGTNSNDNIKKQASDSNKAKPRPPASSNSPSPPPPLQSSPSQGKPATAEGAAGFLTSPPPRRRRRSKRLPPLFSSNQTAAAIAKKKSKKKAAKPPSAEEAARAPRTATKAASAAAPPRKKKEPLPLLPSSTKRRRPPAPSPPTTTAEDKSRPPARRLPLVSIPPDSRAQLKIALEQQQQQMARPPGHRNPSIKCVCGYCRDRFESRSKLFRHLREANDCRKLALSHGMPLENPIRAVERRLRRRYGDLLLAGCIVIRVKTPVAPPPPNKRKQKKQKEIEESPSSEGVVLEANLRGFECVIVRSSEGKQKPGFPKGKIEGFDANLLSAALRETWEEAGVPATRLRVLPASSVAAANATAVEGGNAELARLFDDDEAALLDDTIYVVTDDDEDEDEDSPNSRRGQNDDEDDEEEAVVRDDHEEKDAYASIDVREVTGRQGKRARYFVCGVKGSEEVPLTSVNDLDGDIAEVTWMDVSEALAILERRRRAALRRAILIYAADERINLTEQLQQQRIETNAS